MRIRAKILFPVITLTLLTVASILFSNIVLFSGFVDDSTVDRVGAASQVALEQLSAMKTGAAAAALSIAKDPEIAQALMGGDRDNLLAVAARLQHKAGIDFCTITDAQGLVVARTHALLLYGDSVLNQANVASALLGETFVAIEEGSEVRLSVRAGAPIYDANGEIIGAVSSGFRLDTRSFVSTIKDMLGCEATIVLGSERISSTIKDAVGTFADSDIVDEVSDGDSYSGQVDILGRVAVARYSAIAGPDGRTVGMIFIGQYFDEELSIIWDFVRSGLLITVVLLTVFIIIILVTTGRIVTPIHAMTAAATALAQGDTDIDVHVNTDDEMRVLANAFNSMIENTRRQVDAVERIADGDTTVVVKARSDKDIMNRSLVRLNATLFAQAAALQEEHERIRVMLDATPLASRLWDRQYNLIECNEAAVKLFGMRSKQEYIERFYELAPEFQPGGQPTRELARALIHRAFEQGAFVCNFIYKLLDGTPLPAEVTAVRIPFGNSYVVATYSRDLREQQKMLDEIRSTSDQLEAALVDARDANSAKSSFLAQMSHEIRSPLNAVVGLSELALTGDALDDSLEEKLEKIHTSGMTILSIVNDILDISKIESGKFEIFPTRYDTPSLLNDVIALNVVRKEEKSLDFRLIVDENLPGTLLGDDLRVKQIFNNLLSNAIKYTNEGEVEWRVSFERDGDSVWLISSVTDTGIGIREEDIASIFADYKQVDLKTNRKVTGTGLGLAITKRLVEMMDGTISIKSEYGKGSTFTVRIRQAFVSETPIGAAVADNLMGMRYTLSKRAKGSKLLRINLSYAHVLVVDDIVTNLDVVKGMLRPYGLKIDLVTSGAAAIDMIRAGSPRYSAIFMDHMMPEMDGIEAARIIRKLGTSYAREIPIIALTANAIVGNEEMFLSSGFQAFISKPIDMMKLDAVLRTWVRDKAKEAILRASGEDEFFQADVLGERKELAGISLAGLDLDKALERFGGSEAVFIDVLRSYAAGTRPLLRKLSEYLAAGNLADYAITVHGIKGSSYGIYAMEVGALAAKLEKAAKAQEFVSVEAGHSNFIAAAGEFLDGLEDALGKIDEATEKPIAAQPDQALLDELSEASASFDMDRVDAAMEALEAFRYERGAELVQWLREKVNDMAFEDISALGPDEILDWLEKTSDENNPNAPAFTAPDARILIADDNETSLRAALGLFAPFGAKLDTARDGVEALSMIQSARYDLVFMDHMMPRLDGIAATQRLRRMDGEYYKRLPVIAFSASDDPALVAQFMEAGMNDIAKKPIDMGEIREIFERWLPEDLKLESGGTLESSDASGAADALDAPEELPAIKGSDPKTALRYLGTRELFFDILADFYKLIDIKAAKIEQSLAEGNIRDVTIEVHALAHSSEIVGAVELAEGFRLLEKYGNYGNADALRRETPAVLEKLREFKENIRPFAMPQREKEAASKDEILALLQGVRASMESCDLKTADEAMARLEGLILPKDCQERLELLGAYVADAASEQAVELAQAMIGLVEQA